MAKRPIFITEKVGPILVREQEVEFVFSNGFSLSQKQKSIESLHEEAYDLLQLEGEILEVSTKSIQPIGTQLSAFNLSITTESYGEILLEAAFQGSKVFETVGQDTDLYRIGSGSEIKKRMREKADDKLMMFSFDGDDWMLEPKTAFYDWIYLQALKQRDSHGRLQLRLRTFRHSQILNLIQSVQLTAKLDHAPYLLRYATETSLTKPWLIKIHFFKFLKSSV